MAEKDTELIIAYFSSADKAQAAGLYLNIPAVNWPIPSVWVRRRWRCLEVHPQATCLLSIPLLKWMGCEQVGH